ncbi:MAG: hypothetical protein GY853_08855 [PVC group bacterium]|nr:hypothetical protein [PVC group bacterium]
MVKQAFILFLTLILCGCAPKHKTPSVITNRYDSMEKQTSFVSVRFPMESEDLVGKTRSEVRDMLGTPARVKNTGKSDGELWIYYPQDTNNFIAILVTFEGEKVKECSYESVL